MEDRAEASCSLAAGSDVTAQEPDSTQATHLDSSASTEDIPAMSPPDPALLKPFAAGWRRELVVRNPTGDNKRRVDVYYYTPSGAKLRSLKNIVDHLEGTDLTLDNFTFTRSSLGVGDPEKEIVRNAKRSSGDSSAFGRKVKRCRRSDLSGTPRVVLRSAGGHEGDRGDQGDEGDAAGSDTLDEETCGWLPPVWGKLLSILNRQ